MSNFWATSDWHFQHKNICKGCSDWSNKDNCRDFNTIEEHDAYILNELNRKVKREDLLFFNGDMGFGVGKVELIKSIRERINCENIYWILGNHDHVAEEHSKTRAELEPLFKKICLLYFRSFNKQKIVMCHYAMRTFPWQQHGAWMLYGHSHSSLPDDPNSLSLDVGVDTCLYGHEKYTPYSFDELRHIMTNHKTLTKIDHHGKDTPA